MVPYINDLSRVLDIVCVQSLMSVIDALNVTAAGGDTEAAAADLVYVNQQHQSFVVN
jgi:hypothetical protein